MLGIQLKEYEPWSSLLQQGCCIVRVVSMSLSIWFLGLKDNERQFLCNIVKSRIKSMKKNILVINAHDLDCGAGLSCASTMVILANAGYNIVHVSSSKGKIVDFLKEKGIPTIHSRFSCWYPMEHNGGRMNCFQRIRSIQYNLREDVISLIYIRKALKSLGFLPDLVYTNTILFPIGTLIASKYHVPHVFHIREYGYQDFRMYFLLGTKISSYWAKKSTVMSLCISKGVQNVWNDFFDGKTKLLYNGIPNKGVVFRIPEFDKQIFNIILVGRLSEEKGQEFVIRRLPEIIAKAKCKLSLDLWGEGKDKAKLVELVRTLHLEDFVHFCGFSENINYSKYHLAIMSSRSEGFGRTTVEYMFHSIPIIGYDEGATPELVKDKVTGRLYKTSEEFIDCVLDALSSYPIYQDYARNAFKYSIENFTIENYKSKILDFFENQIK